MWSPASSSRCSCASFRALALRLRDARPRVGTLGALLAGGLAVGALALAVQGLGGASSEVLVSGQSALPSLLTQTSGWLVFAILLAKAFGYAVCLGSGSAVDRYSRRSSSESP